MLVLSATPEQRLTDTSRRIIERDFAPVGSQGVPPWVVGTTATFDSPVFNRESPAVLLIRERVMSALLGRTTCEIQIDADSKSTNFQGLVTGWPEQTRRMLAAVDGFVPADDGLMDPRWALEGMSPTATPTIGVRPTNPGSGATVAVTYTDTGPAIGGILLVRIPAGGTANLTVNGTTTPVTIPATAGWHQLDIAGSGTGPLTVRVESTADLYVAGIVLAYAEPRLRITNAARPSSAASDWNPAGPTGRWATVVDGPASDPDVIIAGLGTNEIADLAALTTFYNALANRGVPVIILNPGGLGGARSRPDAEALANHLYGIAQAHDWPLIDLERVIGDYNTANQHGLMLDALHENTRGALLAALAILALIGGL